MIDLVMVWDYNPTKRLGKGLVSSHERRQRNVLPTKAGSGYGRTRAARDHAELQQGFGAKHHEEVTRGASKQGEVIRHLPLFITERGEKS